MTKRLSMNLVIVENPNPIYCEARTHQDGLFHQCFNGPKYKLRRGVSLCGIHMNIYLKDREEIRRQDREIRRMEKICQ